MTCYNPISVWKKRDGKGVAFKLSEGWSDMPMKIPCNKCIGCRLEYAQQWATRIMHEASFWDDNSFITLTYNDKNYTTCREEQKRNLQLFMKSLRKEVYKKYGKHIRYYSCIEYGEINARCHYHIAIFNHNFPDRIPYSYNQKNTIFRSPELEKIWKKGFSTVGDLTTESAGYIARYMLKKQKGKEKIDESIQPIAMMSRRPGIGKKAFEKYHKNWYVIDAVTDKGQKKKIPRYYDKLLEKEDEEEYRRVKVKREIKKSKKDNKDERRLEQEGEYRKKVTKLLKRSL